MLALFEPSINRYAVRKLTNTKMSVSYLYCMINMDLIGFDDKEAPIVAGGHG
jgi:hypothetical protein